MAFGEGQRDARAMGRGRHSFHVPVMGTGYTIDSPLRVAKYGISSVISLVDDILIEQMRKLHSEREGEPYEEIGLKEENCRARRITAYLNLLDRLIRRQVEELQASDFEPGSEITRYYELLPEGPLRRRYHEMVALPAGEEKTRIQQELRRDALPGGIDTNIMTKLDRSVGPNGEDFGPDSSDALAAARGYAESTLRGSTLVLSAGMNPRLFSYIARLDGFRPDENGLVQKTLTLKVSDYRSALIQGKFLAKKGAWVSEYRVESGLNCGGHAFATKGLLLGPILEKFKRHKEDLVAEIRAVYLKALGEQGRPEPVAEPEVQITVQGGVGTATEQTLMQDFYDVDCTGWATPFLLVPEVTNVDDAHLEKLSAATGADVYLSDASPLLIPFWNLRESASEQARRERIARDRPGSPCPNGYAVTTDEFTEIPQCLASRAYQKLKLRDLGDECPPHVRELVLVRSCICHDLAGGATIKNGIDPEATSSICPGPGIQDFSRIASLDEMVGHIYGRNSLVTNELRPHMFIRELGLYVDHLRGEDEAVRSEVSNVKPKYLHEFRENLLAGIEYYRGITEALPSESRSSFLADLEKLDAEIAEMPLTSA